MAYRQVYSGGYFNPLNYEFGISEKVSDVLGQSRNDQGGSNLFGSPQQAAPYTPTTTQIPSSQVTVTSTPGGQVQGASTSPGGGYTPPSGDQNVNVPSNPGPSAADAEASRREEEARRGINLGYDQYESGLRGMEGGLNMARDENVASTNSLYDKIFGGLTEQKDTTMQKIDANRGEVRNREAQSIKDLQQNLGQTVRGMSMQLGAMGAGDTSATKVMMPYAYTKIAGNEEAGIRKQSNQQLFEIDQDEKDTEMAFNQMWTETETDKAGKIQGIKDYYAGLINQVKSAIVNAPLERQKDLAGLNTALLQEAQANLRQIEAEDRQKKNNIQTWATGRLSELNNMRLELAGNANFNPQDIVFNELKMLGADTGKSGDQSYSYNPMAIAKQRRDEYFA